SPRTKISAKPFRRNSAMTLPRKFTNLVEVIPRELFALQPLDFLRLGFFHFRHHCSRGQKCGPKNKKPTLPLTSGTWASELRALNLYYVRCCLKPDMDVSRHIQQSHGQHIIWQEKFMLEQKYAKGFAVSTQSACDIANTSHRKV